MAKKVIADEIAQMIAGGNVVKAVDNKFVSADGQPLAIRNMESTQDPLEVGDVISVPADFQVLTEQLNGRPVSFIMAEVKAADGSERNMRFFPNSLAKIAYPLDENRRRMAKVKTGGAVAQWVQGLLNEGKDVNYLVSELAGKKKIKVTAKTPYTVYRFGTNNTETQGTSIYSYDWA